MIIISGRSCTGKDTVVNKLVKNHGYKRAITYTTRPMRKGEIEGETYYYLSVEEFLRKYIDGFFLEVKYFNTKEGIWFYGSSVESYERADDDTVFILTPDGLSKLNERNIKHKSFLIDVSDEEIINRQVIRGDYSTPEKESEAKRRFEHDKVDFCNVENIYDFKISENDMTPTQLAELISKLDKGEN